MSNVILNQALRYKKEVNGVSFAIHLTSDTLHSELLIKRNKMKAKQHAFIGTSDSKEIHFQLQFSLN